MSFKLIIVASVLWKERWKQSRQVMKVLRRLMVNFDESTNLLGADNQNVIIVRLSADVHLVWILKEKSFGNR